MNDGGGSMKNTHLIPVIGLAALLGFSACLIYVAEPQGRDFSQPAAEYSDSISIDEGGRLSLKNEEGVVEIEGWDEREIELTAKKMFKPPAGGNVRIYTGIERMLPDIRIDRTGSRVDIETVPAPGRERASRVDYVLMVPRYIHLDRIVLEEGDIWISSIYGTADISVERGDVTVENFSGSLSVHTGYGSADVYLFDLRDRDEIVVIVEEGDITINLEEQVNAHIEAEAVDGFIRSEFTESTFQSGELYRDTLGAGGARISVRTRKGGISFGKIVRDTP